MNNTVEIELTEMEEKFIHYKKNMCGRGYTMLIDTIFALDDENRKKMAKGFPELVEVVHRYGNERGYWQDLVARYNDKYHLGLVP